MPWGVWGVSVRGGFQDPAGNDGDDDRPRPAWRSCPAGVRSRESVAFVPACRGEYPGRRRGWPAGSRSACGRRRDRWTSRRRCWSGRAHSPSRPLPEAEGSQASDGLATRDRAGHWGDLLGVRPYRRGDPLRRVHWGLTARHGELIVREVQSNAVPRVQIVLDTRPAAHAGSGPDGSREWAIRVAASLAEGWIDQGAEVELILDGKLGPPARRLGPGTRSGPCSMPWRGSRPAATGTSRSC